MHVYTVHVYCTRHMHLPECHRVQWEVSSISGWYRDGVGGFIRLALLVCSLHRALVQVTSIITTLEVTQIHNYMYVNV